MITSTQNPRVKAAVKLRVARERKKQGRIIIDGARSFFAPGKRASSLWKYSFVMSYARLMIVSSC